MYILTDENGVIVATSLTGDFGTQNFGSYNAYAFNYESVNPPSTLPNIGVNISQITNGCGIFSTALQTDHLYRSGGFISSRDAAMRVSLL